MTRKPMAGNGKETVAGTAIPFNRPAVEGRELEYVKQAVEAGHIAAGGPLSAQAAGILQQATQSESVVLTTSCTDALEMSALLLDIRPGDTVIVPSFAFPTTALAFVRAGARILFADIEPHTLGIDPSHVARLMDETVRAVVPIHYAGIGCDLANLQAVLSTWERVDLVEDNAHGLFGTYRGSPLGGFGRFATLSFHETKNFTCGEGGALVVNQPEDVERAFALRDKGTNRRQYLNGQVDKYSWVDTGSSFGLSDLLGGYLLGQLEQRERIMAKRRAIFERYMELLGPSAGELGFSLPVVPTDRTSAYHMFYVLLSSGDVRNQVLRGLRSTGIHATFHYVPLHSSSAGMRYARANSDCPVTEAISSRLLRLPFYNDLSLQDVQRTAETFLREVRK